MTALLIIGYGVRVKSCAHHGWHPGKWVAPTERADWGPDGAGREVDPPVVLNHERGSVFLGVLEGWYGSSGTTFELVPIYAPQESP